ncbi:p360-15R [African swine fever virus]|uniref:p360-15R n=1 Tax=African swine fever virus TaxID=10497 RepID=A0A2Z5DG66_ASF|nr:p360-15R [African swine fever virus]AXB49557.1 p360-15R [African swine fever virus]AXB49729.1 p360-15R [African swine fever virus]AXB49900.1 p360-15R [African swine fever virus]AXB50073.1 p360-15R [African swine fever virus]
MQNKIPNFNLFFFFLYKMLEIVLATLLGDLQQLKDLTPKQRAVAFFRANTKELEDFLYPDGQTEELLPGFLLNHLLEPSGPIEILTRYHLFRQNPKAGRLRGLEVKMLERLYDANIYNMLARLRPELVRDKAVELYWLFRAILICHGPLVLEIVRHETLDFAETAFICAAYFSEPQVMYALYNFIPPTHAVLADAIQMCLESNSEAGICYVYLMGGNLKGKVPGSLRKRLRDSPLRQERKKKNVLPPHEFLLLLHGI